MKNKQLISIVILIGPNRGKELFKAIRSVLNSTYKNYELILVDNSSNLKLKKEILNKFSSVKLYIMPFNTGMVGYSIGFANVKGEYILALDDDCTIEKNTLEKIVLAFNNLPQKVGIIATNVYNPIRKYFYYSKYVRENTRTIYTFPGGASAFKKEIFDKIGYYDNDFFCWLHEDDLAIRLINSGYEIYFDKNIIINHHDPEEYRKIRKNKFVLTFRNKAWFNLKYFSLIFIPILIIRDIVWIVLLPLRTGSFKTLLYGLEGYLLGYFMFLIPVRKRTIIPKNVQKTFLRSYLFNKPS